MPAPPRLVLPLASALLALILVLALALGAFSKSSSNDTGAGSASRADGGLQGAVLPAAVHAPSFTLTNQSGRAVSLRSYRGKLVVLVFLDSNCRPCVLVAQQVRDVLDELAASGDSKGPVHGVQAIFISTDPGVDTRASINRFLAETSLDGRVQYLTGKLAELRPVWRAYRLPPLTVGQQETSSAQHSQTADEGALSSVQPATSVLLIDRRGVERVEFGLEDLTPEALEHDIQTLQTG
jgi:cytochrome oxidase Cu insertion factor (SCO1/SenC/PrrC family)